MAKASIPTWLYIVGMGVITGFLPYLFYSKGLEAMESSRASILAFVEPAGGTVLGMIVFSEFPTIFGYAGILLVLSAIILLGLKKKQ